MPGNQAVKNTAKVALRGFSVRAVFVVLVFVSAAAVCIFVNEMHALVFGRNTLLFSLLFNSVYVVTLLSPLALGIIRWYWRATGDVVDPIYGLFRYFLSTRDFIRAVKFSALFFARIVVIAAAAMLPYFLLHMASLNRLYDFFGISMRTWSVYLWVLENLFFVLGIAAVIVLTVRLYLAPVLFVACDTMNPSEILYMSGIISRDTAGPFIILLIGFFGWMLLTLLGVPALYTLPYFITSYTVHCRYAVNHYNHNVDVGQQLIFPQYRSTF